MMSMAPKKHVVQKNCAFLLYDLWTLPSICDRILLVVRYDVAWSVSIWAMSQSILCPRYANSKIKWIANSLGRLNHLCRMIAPQYVLLLAIVPSYSQCDKPLPTVVTIPISRHSQTCCFPTARPGTQKFGCINQSLPIGHDTCML